ncbi:MAG: hypothetical protein CM15mV127_470 [Caudoviricetes sp.]|nr:MAG: hypothetical protein CM15mV127_470 [Caudoviricetes sp.]
MGYPWPIFIEPIKKRGFVGVVEKILETQNSKGRQVNLKPGDMLLYKGADLEHWEINLKEICVHKFFYTI